MTPVTRRVVVWAAVAGLHGALGSWLLLPLPLHGRQPAEDALPITLFPPDPVVLPEPPPDPALRTEPETTAASPAVPDERPAAPPSAMAVSGRGVEFEPGNRETATPIVEAADFDTAALREACVTAYPDTAADLDVPGSVTVLVRVEASGRPSQTKIVRPGATATLDDAVNACLLSQGSFAPLVVDGRAVASWHRIVWSSRTRP